MTVAVVTDSTCDLPVELVAAHGVHVVPLSVTFGTEAPVERSALTDATFYDRLTTDPRPPTTSQPTTRSFEQVWGAAAAAGAAQIVSVHVSAELSGTVDRATAAAASAPVPVTVVDSRQVSGGLALQVLAAARAAGRGADTAGVVAAAAGVRQRTTSLLAVDSAAFLRSGGRLGPTGPAPGAGGDERRDRPLRARPVLGVVDGRIQPVDRVRTWRRALARLVDGVHAGAHGARLDVVVAHAQASDRAAQLLTALRQRTEIASSVEVLIGPVVGAHTGPGVVGVAAAPARD